MSRVNWPALTGRIVGRGYELERLLSAEETAAEYSARSAQGTRAAVTVAPRGQIAPLAAVAALKHPNIRRVLDGGTEEIDGAAVEYIVFEPGEETLDERMKSGPLAAEEFAPVAAGIASALSYLHERGFVYMHLAPESIVRSGAAWQLANPEFVRAAGQASPAATRAMMSRSTYVPPEAFNGVVSPAWDVWSFGILTQRALTGPPPANGPKRRHRPPALPAPYDTVAARCLEPEPQMRPALDEIRKLLDSEGPVEAAARPARRKARTYDTVIAPPATARADDVAAPETDIAPARTGGRWRGKRLVLSFIPLLGILAAIFVYSQLPHQAPPAAGETPRQDTGQSKNRSVGQPSTEVPAELAKTLPAESPAAAAAPPADRAARRATVFAFVKTWAAATRQRDAQALGELYAPRVDQFFSRSNLTRDEVIREKSQQFRNLSAVRRFDVGRMQIESMTSDRAVVNFRKQWDFRGARPFAGAGRARLVLRWAGGGWQIVREQDLHIDWVRR